MPRRRQSSRSPGRRDPRIALVVLVLAALGSCVARQQQQEEPAPQRDEPRRATSRRPAASAPGPNGRGETPGSGDGAPLTPVPAGRLPVGQAAVGTFNIKWFSSGGPNPRTENDVRDVAQVIQDTGAALLGLQEIGDAAMMNRLTRYLPGYRYVLGTSGGGQHCAILWDSRRAQVGRAVEWPDTNQGLTSSADRLRAPLVAPARVGNFDFLFVVVHAKAMFDERSVRIRREQMSRLRARLDEYEQTSPDKDVIVVGDFNDFVGSRAMAQLTGDRTVAAGEEGFVNTGANLPDEAITHLDPNGRIDHVIVSSPAVSDEEWTDQVFVYPKPRGAERKRYEDGVSDHLPAWATFRVARDNDP